MTEVQVLKLKLHQLESALIAHDVDKVRDLSTETTQCFQVLFSQMESNSALREEMRSEKLHLIEQVKRTNALIQQGLSLTTTLLGHWMESRQKFEKDTGLRSVSVEFSA